MQYNFSTLVSKQYFLEHATKELVFVQVLYGPSDHCKSLNIFSKSDWYKFLTSKGFHIIRTVCTDFYKAPSHMMSEESFQEAIYEKTRRNVTLLFSLWEGIFNSQGKRVALKGSQCNANYNRIAGFASSTSQPPRIVYTPFNSTYPVLLTQRILKHVDQFISEQLSGEKYIAVMLRTESLHIGSSFLSVTPYSNNTCINGILSDWKKLVQQSNVSKTLFFTDSAKHGSLGWNSASARRFSDYIHDALNLDLPLDKVNSIFEKMTGSKDSMQMAILHQQLVAHATCIVVIGGGTFQFHTISMYSHNHRGQECYAIRQNTCDRRYISQVYGREVQ